MFILEYGLYLLADKLSWVIGTAQNAWSPKIPVIDDLFPVVAIFSVIYVFSYVFWVFGTVAVSLTEREHFYNYLIGLGSAFVLGSLVIVFFPTYMDRMAEGLFAKSGGPGFPNAILRWVYAHDGMERASDLFPSFHCLYSMYCYLGVRKRKEISKPFRVYTLVMAILIFLSTLFTKQHYILDVVGGISIALVCNFVVGKINPGARIIASKSSKSDCNGL